MATRDPKHATVIPLEDLITALTALQNARGVERVRLARQLSATDAPTLATIRAAGDLGMWQATRPRGGLTQREVAAELGYGSVSRVNDAVLRHKRRLNLK